MYRKINQNHFEMLNQPQLKNWVKLWRECHKLAQALLLRGRLFDNSYAFQGEIAAKFTSLSLSLSQAVKRSFLEKDWTALSLLKRSLEKKLQSFDAFDATVMHIKDFYYAHCANTQGTQTGKFLDAIYDIIDRGYAAFINKGATFAKNTVLAEVEKAKQLTLQLPPKAAKYLHSSTSRQVY